MKPRSWGTTSPLQPGKGQRLGRVRGVHLLRPAGRPAVRLRLPSRILTGKKETYAAVHCVLDNEETGSTTKQGAASTFLSDTLERICGCLDLSREDYLIRLSESFMLSADNAHAVHPNHPDKADPSNRPYLNEGIVLKFNASQKYCTDGISAAMFRDICKKAGVPVQTFANRSDMAGGSTLGNIASTHVAVSTADIGLPQLAMHSPYETAAWRIQNI